MPIPAIQTRAHEERDPRVDHVLHRGGYRPEGGRGRDERTVALALHRAQVVCGYLRSRGVKATAHIVSASNLHPIASNATRAGRAQNRRVTIPVR